MKKLIYLLCALPLLWACSNNEDEINEEKQNPQESRNDLPSTEVFVQGALLNYTTQTRSHGYGDKWPCVNAEEGWESARFSIRIDGQIPGYINQSSSKYWGGFSGPNLGKVFTSYPYGRYDDRGFDYYLVDKASGKNIGLFRYVFDPEGVQTVKAIKEFPSVKEFLTYVRDNSSNASEKNTLTAILENVDVDEDLKVIWYVVKEVGRQYGWHVNGVLTTKDTESVYDIPKIKEEIEKDVKQYNFEESHFDPNGVPDNVEVDIHLQEHKDWNEIKTSTHIRTDAGSVTINLPLDESYIVEQDDFAVRFYDYYYKEYAINHEITHDANGITIKINNIDSEFVQDLKRKYGDGLTVEVHSYCTQLEGIWEQLKNSTVVTGNPCTLKGQITNAYKPEERVLIGE